MLVTRANNLLNKMKPLAKPVLAKILEKSEGTAEGSYSTVSFHHMRGMRRFRLSQNAKLIDSLSVAFLKPKPTSTRQDIKEAIDAEKLLLKKNVPSHFNHYNLYHDEQGERLAVRSDKGDLWQFIHANRERLTAEEVKDITAQVILAVFDLHSRGIVHRDIKPENFLVFVRNGKYHIKLHDHNRAIKVNKETGLAKKVHSMSLTHVYSSPELLKVYEETDEIKNTKEKQVTAWALHATLNFKAIDCFALGETIKKMGFLLPPRQIKSEFKLLYTALTRTEIQKRPTIEKVMEFSFFGETPKKRKLVFDKQRARAKNNNLIIDEYSEEPVVLSDPFFLLDQNIKPIHYASKKALEIAEQIASCDQTINEGCASGNFSEIAARFNSLNRNTSRLVKTVALVKAPEYKADLLELKQDAEIQTTSIIVKLLKDKRAMACMLKKAVEETYADYVRVNKMENAAGEAIRHCFDFFMLHGRKGHEEAKAFKARVEKAFQRPHVHPKEIFNLIQEHYFRAGGNTYKHSFKTMLLEKLHKLTDYSIEGWQHHFDTLDGPLAAGKTAPSI